ncbi:MAG: hypothetical protein JNM96_05565, partial [Bacteroidia bacterium]|nr:hypothetical protein [Bacteroidia bacterium]
MKPLFKILASVILFSFLPLISQNVAYFDQFGIKDGLSQSSINALVQDKLGIFWFATQDGLNRYSYHENKIFNHIPFDKNSISGNQINDLFTDKEGNIWILSNGGIDYINPINFKITNVLKLKNCKEFESISKAWLANTYLILNTNKGIFVVKDLILNPEKFEKIDFKFKTEGRFSVIAITPI